MIMSDNRSVLSRRSFFFVAAAALAGCQSTSPKVEKPSSPEDPLSQLVHSPADPLVSVMADRAFGAHKILLKNPQYFPIHRGSISHSYLQECFENLFKGSEGETLRAVLTDSKHHPAVIAQVLAARARSLKPDWVSSLYGQPHFEVMIDRIITDIEPYAWSELRDIVKTNVMHGKLGKLQQLELEILFYMSFGLDAAKAMDMRYNFVKLLVEKAMEPVDPKSVTSRERDSMPLAQLACE